MRFEITILGIMLVLGTIAACFIIIPQFIWLEEEGIPVKREADPEVANGILTVSSIIFGFQFAFFKPPAEKLRAIWVIALIYQVIGITWVGFNYVNDTMNLGFLTTDTLKLAYFVLATIVLATVLLAWVDWGLQLGVDE